MVKDLVAFYGGGWVVDPRSAVDRHPFLESAPQYLSSSSGNLMICRVLLTAPGTLNMCRSDVSGAACRKRQAVSSLRVCSAQP